MLKAFFHGARPKTLSAAVSPVAIGAALAWAYHYNGPRPDYDRSTFFGCNPDIVCTQHVALHEYFNIWITLLCFVVAIAMQVGVNYANDYSDGVKGTDDNRMGPMRLVGSGRASAKSVLIATWISFSVAAIAGIIVALLSTLWFIPVGALCVVLAWFYTGGKHPYGYYGFGELSVFICFGFVATVGTFLANANPHHALSNGAPFTFDGLVVVAGCIPGLYSVAILLANNIRDIETDKVAGKKTLAVRVGKPIAQKLYVAVIIMISVASIFVAFSYPFVGIVVVLIAATSYMLVRQLCRATTPPQYISVLVTTSKMNLVVGVLIAVLIVASAVLIDGKAQYEAPIVPIVNDTEFPNR